MASWLPRRPLRTKPRLSSFSIRVAMRDFGPRLDRNPEDAMRPVRIALALALSLPLAHARQEDAAAKATTSGPQEELQGIRAEFDAAYQEFLEKLRAAETQEESHRIFEEDYPDVGAFAVRFLDLARRSPKSEVAWESLGWIVQKANESESLEPAIGILVADFAGDERMGDLCTQAGNAAPNAALLAALKRLSAESPLAEVRGKAAFGCAMQLKALGDEAGCEKLLERVVSDYADLGYHYTTLGVAAEGELFELRRLQIGMLAPDIEGEDLDGVPFKLSDYRGKVVVLDFWGHW